MTVIQKRFKELGKDFLIYGLFTGVAQFTTLLLLPLLARKISVQDYGIFEVLAILSNLTSVLINFSLPSAIARLFFDDPHSNVDHPTLVTSILFFVVVVGGCLLAAGWLFSDRISILLTKTNQHSDLINISLLNGYLTSISAIPKIVLRINRNVIRFNVINLTYSIILFSTIFVTLVFLDGSLKDVVLCTIIASSIQTILCFISIVNFINFKISLKRIKDSLLYSLPLLPAVLVGWINEQADRIILLSLIGLSAVGIYGAAAKIAAIIKFFAIVFRSAWEPLAISQIRSDETERNIFYRDAQTYFWALFFVCACMLSAFAPEIFKLLLPHDYFQGCFLLPWICGAIILHTSGSISNIGILIKKSTIFNTIAAFVGAVLNILISLTLVPLYGLNGAALGTFAAELSFTVLLMFFSMQTTSIRFDIHKLFSIFVFYCIVSTLNLLSVKYIQITYASFFIRLMLSTAFLIVTLKYILNVQPIQILRNIRSKSL